MALIITLKDDEGIMIGDTLVVLRGYTSRQKRLYIDCDDKKRVERTGAIPRDMDFKEFKRQFKWRKP